jgi:glycosyltransferase involved in cell wall biosynthesis
VLTATIIAKNAEATIGACVASLNFCDRVLVGVHDPQDPTAVAARSAGATVVHAPWQGYGPTKNRLLEQAEGEWIFSVDADEVVSSELREQIKAFLAHPGQDCGAWINRRNFFLGQAIRHCGWQPDWQLRLIRKNHGRFDERPVHEALHAEGPVRRLAGYLDHYTYPTLSHYWERLNAYTTLAAGEKWAKSGFSFPRLFLDPVWTFGKMYILKLGFLDGFRGFLLCLLSAVNTLVKHAKIWEFTRQACRF